MGDRDAFGREKDENSLEGMGWSTGSSASTPAPVPQPVPRPAPASREELPGMVADVAHEGVPGTHAPAAPTFPDQPRLDAPPRRRSGGGLGGVSVLFRLVRGLIPLAIIIALVAGAGGALVDSATDKATEAIESATDDLSITTETPAEPGTPEAEAQTPSAPKPSAPATPPTGLRRGSLLLQQHFGAAMRKLRTGGYGRLTNLRVAPERIDATLVTKGGRLRNIQFQPGGTVRDFGTTGPGFGRTATMSIADINSAAPFRLTASAAGRLKVPATRVNYLVYSLAFGPDARWYVYFKSGEIFAADARGRISRRIS